MVLRRLWTVSLNFTRGREQLVKMSRNIFSRFFYFIFIFSVSEQTFLIHIYPIGLVQWCPTTFALSPHSPQLWRQRFCCRHFCQNLRDIQCIYHQNSNSEQLSVATFNSLVATCGEWRQGWTTLVQCVKKKKFNIRHNECFTGKRGLKYPKNGH